MFFCYNETPSKVYILDKPSLIRTKFASITSNGVETRKASQLRTEHLQKGEAKSKTTFIQLLDKQGREATPRGPTLYLGLMA